MQVNLDVIHTGLSESSQLCVSCGMCCDGTLFAIANRKESDDIALLDGIMIPVEGGFKLPCPTYDNTRGCTSYHCRAHVCSAYKCKLLKELEKNGIHLDQALDIVSKAKVARNQIREEIQHVSGNYDTSEALFPQLRNTLPNLSMDEMSLAERKKFGKLYIQRDMWIKRVREHFSPHFLKKKDREMRSEE